MREKEGSAWLARREEKAKKGARFFLSPLFSLSLPLSSVVACFPTASPRRGERGPARTATTKTQHRSPALSQETLSSAGRLKNHAPLLSCSSGRGLEVDDIDATDQSSHGRSPHVPSLPFLVNSLPCLRGDTAFFSLHRNEASDARAELAETRPRSSSMRLWFQIADDKGLFFFRCCCCRCFVVVVAAGRSSGQDQSRVPGDGHHGRRDGGCAFESFRDRNPS